MHESQSSEFINFNIRCHFVINFKSLELIVKFDKFGFVIGQQPQKMLNRESPFSKRLRYLWMFHPVKQRIIFPVVFDHHSIEFLPVELIVGFVSELQIFDMQIYLQYLLW